MGRKEVEDLLVQRVCLVFRVVKVIVENLVCKVIKEQLAELEFQVLKDLMVNRVVKGLLVHQDKLDQRASLERWVS